MIIPDGMTGKSTRKAGYIDFRKKVNNFCPKNNKGALYTLGTRWSFWPYFRYFIDSYSTEAQIWVVFYHTMLGFHKFEIFINFINWFWNLKFWIFKGFFEIIFWIDFFSISPQEMILGENVKYKKCCWPAALHITKIHLVP